VLETVYLIQHDALSGEPRKERLLILQFPADARQLAVEVGNPRERLAQKGFADTPDAGEPDDRSLAPRLLDTLDPEPSLYHTPS
jgi:hypothetical protein